MSATCVLDASAVLAWLKDEPGGERIAERLSEAAMSAVNASEVFDKNLSRPQPNRRLLRDLKELGMTIEPFTLDDAELAASLRSSTAHLGLSLADRACIALGARLRLPVFTADRAWSKIKSGDDIHADIQVIR